MTMGKMKTSDLIGSALDWAVAKCLDFDTRNNYRVWVTQEDGQITFDCYADDWAHAYEQATNAYPNDHIAAVEHLEAYSPSTNWEQCGPIIERERIETYYQPALEQWAARCHGALRYGPTPLMAAMRCLVASKLGDEVGIPDELQLSS